MFPDMVLVGWESTWACERDKDWNVRLVVEGVRCADVRLKKEQRFPWNLRIPMSTLCVCPTLLGCRGGEIFAAKF